MSARASILSWAGSLEQPWKGATSEQGHCAPTAAADSARKFVVTLHAKKKKIQIQILKTTTIKSLYC